LEAWQRQIEFPINFQMPSAIGIDLGTVFSRVGVAKNGNVEIIANSQRNWITPSVVTFTDRDRKVGDAAKYQMGENPSNTIFGRSEHFSPVFRPLIELSLRCKTLDWPQF
jgi:heat shock 70kDa protein 1/2/6/8